MLASFSDYFSYLITLQYIIHQKIMAYKWPKNLKPNAKNGIRVLGQGACVKQQTANSHEPHSQNFLDCS